MAGYAADSPVESEDKAGVRDLEGREGLQRFPKVLNSAENGSESFFPSSFIKSSTTDFLYLVEPLINRVRKRFTAEVNSMVGAQKPFPLDPKDLEHLFIPALLTRLLFACQRTLILEINIARLQGRLVGETPEQRFNSFIDLLKQTSFRDHFLNKYPVCAESCHLFCEQWLQFSLEFIRHLSEDWASLGELFGVDRDDKLAGISFRQGDIHRDGRSVLIADFKNGLKLVYKPRPCFVDLHLQDLVTWLNEHGQNPPLRVLKVLARGEHGWIEFVQHAQCDTAQQVERYYQRFGGLLALHYSLASVDMHFGNVIAAGEYPVVIDLETVLHPVFAEPASETADQCAQAMLQKSVMGTGLLPVSCLRGRAGETSEIGALAVNENQLMDSEQLKLVDAQSDTVRITHAPYKVGKVQNQVHLNGKAVQPADYVDALATGFQHTYRLLASRRVDLLAQDGPVRKFKGDMARVIFRPTAAYGSLLSESFHPNFLRDHQKRRQHFKSLTVDQDVKSPLTKLFVAEHAQLANGDIPYFSAPADSCDVTGADGMVFKGFLAQSGVDEAIARILSLDERDLARQSWFIRSAVNSIAKGHPPRQRSLGWVKGSRDQGFLGAACAVGHRIADAAISKNGTASWFSTNALPQVENSYKMGLVEDDFYSGLGGIIYFLAYLAEVSDEPSYKELAKAGLRTLELRLEQNPALRQRIGVFDGLGGVLHLATHLGVLWGREDLLDKAVTYLPRIEQAAQHDQRLDVISGSAGVIVCLLNLMQLRPHSQARELALFCGERLLKLATAQEPGIRWETMGCDRGFAHGISGIAWALIKLGVAVNQSKFVDGALKAIDWERHLLKGGHWTLAGKSSQDQGAWCHGAPGIALGRLAVYQDHQANAVREDAERALEFLLQMPSSPENHCLCHGATGNLEALAMAARVFPEESCWKTALAQKKEELLTDIATRDFQCDLFSQGSPGLMTGLAGIGYGLLRLYAPDKVPGVLLLEPPHKG